MIPLTLITGFLGSGKTTLLRRIAGRFDGRKLVFLVNEWSRREVDASLLKQEGVQAIPISGGSIFCRCRAGEFIARLSSLPERYGTAGAPLEGVVVEDSGIADPGAAGRLLSESRLDRVYRLQELTCVVDPSSFLKLMHTLPAVRAQVESAGTVLLNRIDLCTEDQIRLAEGALRDMNPRAKITRTRFCDADLQVLASRAAVLSLDGTCAAGADPSFGRLSLRFKGPVDLQDLESVLRGAGDALCRAKGFVPIEGGTLYVDYVSGRFHTGTGTRSATGIECIVHGSSLDGTRKLPEMLPGVIVL